MASGIRLSVKEVQDRVKKFGLICLSKNYINQRLPLKWKCKKGHIFEKNFDKINRGYHCNECSNRVKRDINDAKQIAKKNNGKLISKNFSSRKNNLEWECNKGHRWFANFNNVFYQKAWCAKCAGNKPKEREYLSNYAKSKGGIFLSKGKEFKSYKKYIWECEFGHKWKATYISVINQNIWCKKCSGFGEYTIKDWRKLAKERKGLCLSKEYSRKHDYLEWQCFYGHTWKQTPHEIQRGTWCPKCSYNYSEEICRETFEQIFGREFIKSRPSWLVGKRGNKIELDGYNKDLKIAFEYNGVQHYKNTKLFKGRTLQEIQANDRIKVKKCKDKKILLIVIDYKTDLKNLPKIIKEKCNDSNLNISKYNFNKKIKLSKIWSHETKLDRLKAFAKKNEGKLLSKRYFGAAYSYSWECKRKHKFKEIYDVLRRKHHFCEICRKEKHLNKLFEVLKKNKYKLLSEVNYLSKDNDEVRYKCDKGHISKSKINYLKRNRLCKKCKDKKK